MRLSENKTATLGLKCIGKASTSYPSLSRDEHERCGSDPQLPSGTECAKAGPDPRLFPAAQLPWLSKKPGDAIAVFTYPAPTPLGLHMRPSPPAMAGDAMELDPVTHRPASSVQPSLPKKQEGIPKPNPKPRRTAKTVRLSPPTVQEDTSKEDQDANIFNRTALRDWFWEHKGLRLDI